MRISNIKNQISNKQSLRANALKPPRKASTMAELMKRAQPHVKSLKKGESIEGTLTKLTPQEILVDIGSKTEAQVLEKDRRILKTILSNLKVGDKVTVGVLNPESEFGYPVVSLRRFVDDILWENLENLQKDKKKLEVTVSEKTSGGYLVTSENGASGFLPNSQVKFSDRNILGEKLEVSVLELDRSQRKIIFSQKPNLTTQDFEELVKNLKPEQKISAIISNIVPFGIFLSIPINEKSVDGFVHLSEISWENVTKVPEDLKIGEKIDAVILGFDKKSARVNLSIKRLTKNPHEEKLRQLKEDQKVKGKVSRVTSAGVYVVLDGIEGIIKKDKIPPELSFLEGQDIDATVSEIDLKNQKVLLVPVLKAKPIGYR